MVVANAAIIASLWLNAHLTATADMDAIPARRAGGAALFNLAREFGASLGAAWMSTMLERESKARLQLDDEHVTVDAPLLREQLAVSREAQARASSIPAAPRWACSKRASKARRFCAPSTTASCSSASPSSWRARSSY